MVVSITCNDDIDIDKNISRVPAKRALSVNRITMVAILKY